MKSIFTALYKGIFAFLFLSFQFPSTGFCQPSTHTGRFTYVDNNINGFWEYLPWHYNAETSRRYPLILFMHGKGEEGDDKEMEDLRKVLQSGTPRIIDRGEFPDSFQVAGKWTKVIVISPQIKDGFDDDARSSKILPSTIQAMINYAKKQYRVDTTQIYLTGMSMGGGATWRYAGSSVGAAKQLAGIVVATGAYDLSMAEAKVIAQTNLPVIATHNLDDNVINANRTIENIRKIVSSNPQMNPYPKAVYWQNGGHNVWRRTFEDLKLGNATLRDTLGVNAYEYILQFQRQALSVPVKWRDFTALASGSGVLIRWSVSNQVNVQSYLVERSLNGIDFLPIANVTPVIPLQDIINYQFMDQQPPSGEVYYRIKQTDFDGRFSYSAIQLINYRTNRAQVLVYPNPFIDHLFIDLSAAYDGPVTIQMTDINGKIIKSKEVEISVTTRQKVQWSGFPSIPKGLYNIVIRNKQGKSVGKFAVVHN